MRRGEPGFAASAVGAVLVAAGVLDFTPGWIFLVGGGIVGLSGLLCLGIRGSVLLLLTGVWISASAFLGWAGSQGNLMASGLLAVALGFLSGVAGTVSARSA